MLNFLSLSELWPTLLSLASILVVMWLALWASGRAIRRMAKSMKRQDGRQNLEEIEQWARQVRRVVRRTIGVVAGIAALVLVLRSTGVRGLKRIDRASAQDWLFGPGLHIVFILVGAYALQRMLRLTISRLPGLVVRTDGPTAEVGERRKRAQTVSRSMGKLVSAVVWGIAGLMVLRELNVDIMPILTGAGIAGLAVGFGAQNLVRDVISGFFIILEDQIRVGDIVIINGKGGLVEAIRLRTTVTRGFDGVVHIFPNGSINEVSNLTKDFSYYVIDLGVAYKENVDHVMQVLREIGAELQRDPKFGASILAPLEVVGVDQFADSAVVIKMRIKTLPLEQFNVGRELRRRIKNEFDRLGIEIPYPHLSLYVGEASKPFAVEMAEKLRAMETAGGGSR